MAALANLNREEQLGLGIAAAAHLALFAFLAVHDPRPPVLPSPERMEVSLAQEVSLTSTAPDPAQEAQAAVAPVLSPEPAPPPPEPIAEPVRERVRPEPVPQPRPTARPSPRPSPRAVETPRPRPSPRAVETPRPATRQTPAPRPSSRATPAPSPSPATRPGGSRIGSDFLAGAGASERSESRGTPAAAFGPAQQAALEQAINRQLKPHWSAPSGVDAELLVTVLAWELNPDGTLKGRPQVVNQSGINESNRPQAALHAERAIRAVQLAAPFALPEEYYDKWRRIRSWRFDRRL